MEAGIWHRMEAEIFVRFDHEFSSEKISSSFRNDAKTGNKIREQSPIHGDRSKNKPEKQENFRSNSL